MIRFVPVQRERSFRDRRKRFRRARNTDRDRNLPVTSKTFSTIAENYVPRWTGTKRIIGLPA